MCGVEPGSSHYISINGYRLRITPNLHAALRSLRNQFVERFLWIDAICINQEDTAEKGQQIAYMAEIYSKASRVIIWLGEGQDGSDKALEEACLAAGEMTKSSSIRPQVKELFLKVLDNPWFERRWVLQEVAAARHVIIKWGPTEVDGYSFCVALSSPELGLLAEASHFDLKEFPFH
ncbi:HET-domain-containing protein [Penicillium malachiteum]|nr:HET-domain-containing protein [Penicillium malachiteum]